MLSFARLLSCHQNGGVFWVKGNLSILGGTYLGNGSPETGGVLFCSEGSQITIEGGIFEDNWARDGGVALVDGGTSLRVESGIFSGNVANGQGGVFAANSEGDIQVGRIFLTSQLFYHPSLLIASSLSVCQQCCRLRSLVGTRIISPSSRIDCRRAKGMHLYHRY